MRPLGTDLGDPEVRPWFLWDEDLTVAALRGILADPDHPRWTEIASKVMREARDDEVWTFLTPRVVATRYSAIAPRLGRRRAFWDYLLDAWKRHGLL